MRFEFRKVEQLLGGYRFRNRELLRQALTHSSLDGRPAMNNLALERYGDYVMRAMVSTYVYLQHPEGTRTQQLAQECEALVTNRSLGQISRTLGLRKFLRGDPTIDISTFGDLVDADLLEALIGAVTLDGGLVEGARVVAALYGWEADALITTLLVGGVRFSKENAKPVRLAPLDRALAGRIPRAHGARRKELLRLFRSKKLRFYFTPRKTKQRHADARRVHCFIKTRGYYVLWTGLGASREEAQLRAIEEAVKGPAYSWARLVELGLVGSSGSK